RIEAISYGIFTLRRAAGRPPWWALDDAPEPLGPCGDVVLGRFARRDFLAARPGERLLDARVALAPDLRWEQQLTPSAEGRAGSSLAGPLPFTGAVDAPLLALLQICQGEKAVRDLLAELAGAMGAQPAQILPVFLQVVRRMIEQGLLLPTQA